MENKYDVFISYKNTDEYGNKTKDAKLADKCYRYLTAKGLNVFHSEVSLESIGKAQYSNVIDDALDTSRFLIAVGCHPENLNARWVRYEWESFLNDIRSNIKPNSEVFVLYKDFKINDLPRALRQQQAFNADSEANFEKLYNFINSTITADNTPQDQPADEPATPKPKKSIIPKVFPLGTKNILKYVLPAIASVAIIALIIFFARGDRQPYQPTHYVRQPQDSQGVGNNGTEINGREPDETQPNGTIDEYEPQERTHGAFLPSRNPPPDYNIPTPTPTPPPTEEEPYDETNETIIKLTLGSTAAYINDEPFTLAIAPFIEDGRTMVPVRCIILQVPDANVSWQNPNLVLTHPHSGTTYLYDNAEPFPGLGTTIIVDGSFMASIRVISNLIGATFSNVDGVITFTFYESL